MTISLDLGSGDTPKNPFDADEVWGVDIVDTGNPMVKVCDLILDPLPFEDNSLDFVVCTDFLEHIPRIVYVGTERRTPFIDVMSETWRVLKPNGTFLAKTPALPRLEAFQDPTHVNFITENTQDYFAGGLVGLTQQYGFKGQFRLIDQYWEGFWLVWKMEAVK
jgi:SAM-dependent methyltransferase